MSEEKQHISKAEWAVMRVVWTLGKCDAKTVAKALEQTHGWAEATVKTLINRLLKKNYLRGERDGRRYIYSAAVAEQATMDTELSTLLDSMCAHKLGAAVNDALERRELSQTDIQQLIATLNAKLATAPDAVACNCVPAGMDDQCAADADCN
ncbi:CopY/TcrY family copper transport repressor [Lacticaseibacillus zhaodongensis]|uniref:CopY/TcrY family copper transport repressor n=1 Tax=Lacticaseibacillus zhaodongensis TaxID=2668065 RepID=UPI0012D2EB48|nr:CopY/TcrY family copper transport repressor [Lacticaseibacillus zhaodongensis]